MENHDLSRDRSTEKIEAKPLWDWPTRILHWTMAGLFLLTFALANLAPERSPAFYWHAVLGLLLGLAVVLRVIWGLLGPAPSRFSSFLFSPKQLFAYVREALRGPDAPVAGHNPGSSYAIYAMLLLPIALAATGILQARGQEWAEEVHAGLAWAMVAVVAFHLLGLAWHSMRHRDGVSWSMIHGRRRMPGWEGIPSTRPLVGAVVAAALTGGGILLVQGLDARVGTLRLPGVGAILELRGEEARKTPAGRETDGNSHHLEEGDEPEER